MQKVSKNLIFICRIVIGSLFVISSIDKIIDPNHFKIIVSEYGILPDKIIPIFVIILPWIQFICSLMLMLNLYQESNALIIICLLVMFIITFGINIARGNASDCGCFDLLGFNEKIGVIVIIRNIFMIFLLLPLLKYDKNRKSD